MCPVLRARCDPVSVLLALRTIGHGKICQGVKNVICQAQGIVTPATGNSRQIRLANAQLVAILSVRLCLLLVPQPLRAVAHGLLCKRWHTPAGTLTFPARLLRVIKTMQARTLRGLRPCGHAGAGSHAGLHHFR